jgi:glycine cleavage system H protein
MSDDFLEVTYDKFIFRVKVGYYYHAEECWANEEERRVTVGVTDFLQRTLGDVVFLQLPKVGEELTQGGYAGTIETIKTTISLFSPVAGRVLEVNGALLEDPQPINTDPYGEGWLFKAKPTDWETDKKTLNDAQAYFPKMEEKIRAEMSKK